ncbi:ATPase [Colletotrichum karsti]|uniref:ATPase n=1 Tax=Colletotrichum karsti TaxID=1095194 RepID=A0A9P6I8R2_9PEZI|nr:ATPase [Colletotrichum karsti]KAF9878030.1 ATPase [Colletotrichum karsti]
MGTLLVANMAPEGLDGSNKKLHPFFVPGKTTETPAAESNTTEEAATLNEKTPNKRPGRPRKQTQTPQTASSDVELRSSDVEDDGRDRKRQKTAGSAPSSGKKRGRPRKKPNGTTTDIANHFSQKDGTSLTKLANEVPRTPPPEPEPTTEQHTSCAPPPTSTIPTSGAASEPNSASAPSAAAEPQPKPTKVLKFNPKTGTIGSPPKPKPVPAEASKGTKSSKSPAKPSRVVTIKYGHDTDSRARIGPQIQQILASPSAKKSSPRSKTTPKKSRPTASKPEDKSKSKGTHPLFLGKSKTAAKPNAPVAPAPKPPRQTVFTSTPCSPKKQRSIPMSGKVPQFGMRSMGLKVPGSCHPAWPAQGMAHVRGLTTEEERLCNAVRHLEVSSRKSKGQTTNIMPSESVISQLASSLDTMSISKSILEATDDDYQPPPPELRLPGKHFESGRKLRSRIKPELRTCLPLGKNTEDSDDEVLTTTRRKPHPAIARLYNSLETNLSAYDKSQCEELTWAQKYAPVLAEEVLQSGKEGILLKEWLQTLRIHSVHTGVANADQKSSGPKSGPAPKNKRKRNKVDDFIVSDGDEAEFLPSVSDEDEDDWFPMTSHGAPKKTVVRKDLGKDMSRLTNAVVLSGPHGSGKTAAVYAVAKELGFEIFEINASSRRTGKDVMEKVGDMTQNHLVQQNRQGKDDDPKEDDETTKDIKSGKQGTMMSFFKPKTASKPALKPEQKSQPKAEEPTEAPRPAKATGQGQKQSLILLEEVDVLYEEDKQFWATIMSLIAQSKRPFVMTCNDETLVPFHNFILYGIFRFTPPPKDLAVDTLLLIAANEGHALQRAAVSALYESKGHDLRASLMELNYWCQLGVGDRRGGFDWFYPRWPKGCDKDENGDVVRVVSESTYLEGMGWVGRDPTVTSSPRAAEEELMTQCWRGLGLDLGNWHDSLDMVSWANSLQTSSAEDRVAALDAFSEFSEAMSTADLCSSGDYGLQFQEPLDPTQPDITNKMRDDFVIGRRLLEAPPLTTFVCTATAIATSLKSAARQILQSAPKRTEPAVSMDCVQERKAIQQMRRSFAEPIGDKAISRYDMSLAFDPIAISEKAAASMSTSLEPSVFDRTMRMITLEVAPYVRSIVDYDHRLMQDRQQRSSLLSEGGRPGKRMRSTRSALSAQEGVTRASARRESYFSAELNTPLVMRTGGEDWQAAVDAEMRLMPQAPSVASSDHGGEVAAPSSSSEVPVQTGEAPIPGAQ